MAEEPEMSNGSGDINPGLPEGDEKNIQEVEKAGKTLGSEGGDSLSNVSSSDAKAQLANLVALVQSIEAETGEPDHEKVIQEVFETVSQQFDAIVRKSINPIRRIV